MSVMPAPVSHLYAQHKAILLGYSICMSVCLNYVCNNFLRTKYLQKLLTNVDKIFGQTGRSSGTRYSGDSDQDLE